MSTIAFVPVRCGSKSIPFKNIKNFCGQPLVYWVLHALQHAKRVDTVIVATDCKEIAEVVTFFKFSKVSIYNRLSQNATDHASTEAVMLEYIKQADHDEQDTFILCQATSPLTQSNDFDQAIVQFENEAADSLLTCCRLKRFIWSDGNTPTNYDFNQRPRRQDFQGSLVENGAFYISSIKNIITSENRLSGKISIYEMPEYSFIELDEPEDWLQAETLMKKIRPHPLPEIKLFLSDIDGVLTDAGMYYSEGGEELKKFSTYDGMAFQLLKSKGIKTGLITSENRVLNTKRSEKMGVDFIYQGVKDKLSVVIDLCKKEGIQLANVAYVGDDINDKTVLESVGYPYCPKNAQRAIKEIPLIHILERKGGEGVIREVFEFNYG